IQTRIIGRFRADPGITVLVCGTLATIPQVKINAGNISKSIYAMIYEIAK
ncbi:10579_t:CDS:1, partial [Cetraspora pellucida]